MIFSQHFALRTVYRLLLCAFKVVMHAKSKRFQITHEICKVYLHPTQINDNRSLVGFYKCGSGSPKNFHRQQPNVCIACFETIFCASPLVLRMVPTNGKYFFPDNDYVRQVDHISGYWNPKRKLGVAPNFSEITALQYGEKR